MQSKDQSLWYEFNIYIIIVVVNYIAPTFKIDGV